MNCSNNDQSFGCLSGLCLYNVFTIYRRYSILELWKDLYKRFWIFEKLFKLEGHFILVNFRLNIHIILSFSTINVLELRLSNLFSEICNLVLIYIPCKKRRWIWELTFVLKYLNCDLGASLNMSLDRHSEDSVHLEVGTLSSNNIHFMKIGF